jgi:hypothetical protein
MQDICARARADTHAGTSLSIWKRIQLRQEVAEARAAVETKPPPENFKAHLKPPLPRRKRGEDDKRKEGARRRGEE